MFRLAYIGLLISMSASVSQTNGEEQTTGEDASGAVAAVATGFIAKSVAIGDERYTYCVYVPLEYTAEQAWPVILFLHGSGERGSDGLLQTEVGIARAIRRDRSRCPAIVVMPQCRPNRMWDDEMLTMAMKCLEAASHEYRMDADRVYLTGLSLGGAGCWGLAAMMPERFAAAVPICGFVGRPDVPAERDQVEDLASRLSHLPIWCFHGGADPVVPPERSRELVEAVKAAGGDVQYTEFEDVGHNSWDRAYETSEFWTWLLQQNRKPPTSRVSP